MARLDDLPLEILALVLVSIKHLDTLRHVSLVSRILHQAAFPLLHHTIKLQKNSDIEGFFELVESEDSSSPCRISQALRRLEFTNEIDLISDEEEPRVKELLNQFKIVIPKLVGLKRLVWNVTKCRYTPMVLSEFQRWCPNLRSLKISAFGSHVPTKESYSQMLGFRDMTYIYLVSSSPNAKAGYRLREHIQDVIVNMIQSSPSLESLGLGLCNYLDASRWDIDNFLEVLNTTFLKLRHLYLWGDFAIDWDHIFHRHHQPSPTRLFFNQHPHLVTLSVGHNPKFSIPVEPRQVQELFPALRHFNGPEFICVALVQSDLRFQLESLEIRVRRYQFGVIKRMADAVTQLPRLHRLVIPGNPKYEQALLTVLSAAPLIEVLDITSYFIWLCSSEELLAVFNHAYNLRELVVRLKDQAYDGRTPITIESFVSRLGRMCPRLETVTNSYGRFQRGLVTHHIVR